MTSMFLLVPLVEEPMKEVVRGNREVSITEGVTVDSVVTLSPSNFNSQTYPLEGERPAMDKRIPTDDELEELTSALNDDAMIEGWKVTNNDPEPNIEVDTGSTD